MDNEPEITADAFKKIKSDISSSLTMKRSLECWIFMGYLLRL